MNNHTKCKSFWMTETFFAELLEVAEALQLDMSKTLRHLLEIGLAEMHAEEL